MSAPSEICGGLFLAVLQAQRGKSYFTEEAERAEYGNHDRSPVRGSSGRSPAPPCGSTGSLGIVIVVVTIITITTTSIIIIITIITIIIIISSSSSSSIMLIIGNLEGGRVAV